MKRLTSFTMLPSWRVVAGCAAASLLFAGLVAQASAQESKDDLTFEQRMIRGLMKGLGANVDQGDIDYRERPPLVIPPSADLVPPESPSQLAKNPAWPKDADVERRKAEIAAEKEDAKLRETYQDDRPLPPQLLKKPNVTARRTERADSPPTWQSERPFPPKDLGTKSPFALFFPSNKPETKTFTAEPPRTALTEPPPGLQTPSVQQPYGVNAPKGGLEKHTDDRPEQYRR